MPVYEYLCAANGISLEVEHPVSHRVATWGELCEIARHQPGDTPADSPVEKLMFPVGVATPKTNTELKQMGFTKLVKRDTGVYENVTASGSESRYMNAGDPSTVPHLSKKIAD